eukprot:TRINITY_DN7158_c0_g1_i2.p1 TRINITY_DN7158_c0_g1~~TRINITY_DN7158_c0_g1_i2.p1  ORF type:complete len:276 (-),score=80.04 TRINITY_DN7158_c0_g1_i2:57-884(-)
MILFNSDRYLLLDYYIGQLTLKITNAEFRLRYLRTAIDCFGSFIDKAEELGIVPKEDIESYHREGKLKPELKREEKINRAKREKETEARLKQYLMRVIKRKQDRESGVLNSDSKSEVEEDDEDERKLELTYIEIAIRKAVEEIEACKEESSMLEQIEKMKLDHGGKLPKEPQNDLPRFQNFVMLPNDRSRLKGKVFGPSYPLPTMTVEEWGEQQMALGNIPAPGSVNQLPKEQEKDYDRDEDDDRKTMKDRSWDDWKDDHPSGDGNKNDNYFRRG